MRYLAINDDDGSSLLIVLIQLVALETTLPLAAICVQDAVFVAPVIPSSTPVKDKATQTENQSSVPQTISWSRATWAYSIFKNGRSIEAKETQDNRASPHSVRHVRQDLAGMVQPHTWVPYLSRDLQSGLIGAFLGVLFFAISSRMWSALKGDGSKGVTSAVL